MLYGKLPAARVGTNIKSPALTSADENQLPASEHILHFLGLSLVSSLSPVKPLSMSLVSTARMCFSSFLQTNTITNQRDKASFLLSSILLKITTMVATQKHISVIIKCTTKGRDQHRCHPLSKVSPHHYFPLTMLHS